MSVVLHVGKALTRAVVLLFALAAAAPAFAQGVTGTLSGTVKDEQGGVVPGATVTLISEAQGTRTAPVVTNATGDFVFPNLTADTYTVQVEMPSFSTLRQAGVAVSPGSRTNVGTLTLKVGGQQEVITVTSEIPLVQATSGERSFNVTTESVTSLPLQNRSYDALLALAPGVNSNPGALVPATRAGSNDFSNFMLDGATAMDPGVNRPAARVSVEAVAEVKVQTSAYAAEFGRSSGLQVNAVTKSGSNQFHGSLYDVERDSRWNANTKENILNGDPKDAVDERDWGFSFSGPVGKAGGNNKLFFYFNYERNPRTFDRGTVYRYRVPTLLERQGDFSQSLDNNGNVYNLIRDASTNLPCTASDTRGCFREGGVVGRIPQSQLYAPGLAILRWWPEPNLPSQPGVAYNYETRYPGAELLGYQPIIRVDYQPTSTIRGSFKFFEYQQPNTPVLGTIPGWNDTREDDYGIWVPAGTFNWTLNSTTFVEASWGANFHHQEGCSITGGAPNFCQNTGNPVNPAANRLTAGFGDIPYIFPDATVLEPGTFSYDVIRKVNPTNWDGTRVQSPPSFQWGNRVSPAPPNNVGPFSNFILDTRTRTINATLTKVQGAHTLKAGYYYFWSYQRRGQGPAIGTINFGQDTNNPLDASFGFANAALGIFNSYEQQSRWGEGGYTAINHEAFIQDAWKVKSNLTFDYGLRFVHQVPQFDGYKKAANFLPDRWSRSDAPQIYELGCAVATRPCPNASRRAQDPRTGEVLGAGSQVLVGALVPDTGNTLNGLFPQGQGIVETFYKYPSLAVAPRTGIAWDVKGNQTFVVRGGAGMFFDRPPANTTYNTVNNPPFTRRVTVRYGRLTDLGSSGLAVQAPPTLTAFEYDQPLPTSIQWNGGVQLAMPFATVLDVAYSGQRGYNTLRSVNINSIDLGAGFDPALQDPTVANANNPTDPATSYVSTNPNLVRYFQGYGNISQQQPTQERLYHSVQISLNRRFRNGLSFGFYDTIGIYDKQKAARRLQHNPDGTITVREDQARADELLGDQHPRAHALRANFTWQLPRMEAGTGARRTIAAILNDWSLSGIWNGQTGEAYAVGYSYSSGGSNVVLTGSPDFAPRVIVTGDPGSGCSDDPLRQFNTSAFRGPGVGSDGLESGNGYLRGCFISSLDLAIARTIQLGGGRQIQLRADVFNFFNQAGITGRNTTMNLANPNAPSTITNLPDEATGVRTVPNGAGFGVANNYQDPRTVQLQVRFQF